MSGPSARTRLGQSTGGEPGTMHKRQRAGIKHIQRGTTHRACGEGCWVSSGARLGLQSEEESERTRVPFGEVRGGVDINVHAYRPRRVTTGGWVHGFIKAG